MSGLLSAPTVPEVSRAPPTGEARGSTWKQVHVGSGQVISIRATSSYFDAWTYRCHAHTCGDYRLARSAVGTTLWSTTPIPDTGQLDGSPITLDVAGSEVLLSFDPNVVGAQPHVVVARDGRGPFTSYDVLQLVGNGACELSQEPGGAVWATRAGGMLTPICTLRASVVPTGRSGSTQGPEIVGSSRSPARSRIASLEWTAAPRGQHKSGLV